MNVQKAPDAASFLPGPFLRWFASRGWAAREHQLELLAKARAGRSVLLIAPTGAGKTLAGFLPSLVELSAGPRAAEKSSCHALHLFHFDQGRWRTQPRRSEGGTPRDRMGRLQ